MTDREKILAFAAKCPILENHIHDTRVCQRSVVVQRRDAANRDGVCNSGFVKAVVVSSLIACDVRSN